MILKQISIYSIKDKFYPLSSKEEFFFHFSVNKMFDMFRRANLKGNDHQKFFSKF